MIRLHAILHKILIILLILRSGVTSQPVDNGVKEEMFSEIPDSGTFLNTITSIYFKNTPVTEILYGVGREYGLNIIIDNSLTDRVTFQLTNISLKDLLLFLADEINLKVRFKNGVLNISRTQIQPEIKLNRGSITLSLDEIPLHEVIPEISKICRKSIIIDNQVPEIKLSGHLNKAPFEAGMKSLLNAHELDMVKNDGVYTIIKKGKNGSTFRSRIKRTGIRVLQDSLITFMAEDVDLSRLVNHISEALNLSYVLNTQLSGKITASLERVSIDEVFAHILHGTGYTFKRVGKTYIIGKAAEKSMETQQIVKLNFLKAAKLQSLLSESRWKNVHITHINENNALLLTGRLPDLNEMESFIKKLDQPVPQVLIEILVIDVNDTRLTEISLESGISNSAISDSSQAQMLLPGFDLLFNSDRLTKLIDQAGHILGFTKIGKLPDNFFLALKALEQKGVLQIHSRPQLATLNGCAADIAIGTTQYYKLTTKTPIRDPSQLYISETETFKTIEASIALQITPWVSSDNRITVEIHPQFNTPIGSFSPEIPPTLQSRSLNSIVRLKNGETIVLGGLVQNITDYSSRGIPFISRIPFLGAMFKGHSKSSSKKELIIYVTPFLEQGKE